MPLLKMEHYLVLTDDIGATRDFYCRVLGMSEGFRPQMEFPGYWVYLGETPCIHIGDREAYAACAGGMGLTVSPRADGTGPVDHIAFNGSDVEGFRQRLDTLGISYGENEIAEVGLRQIFVHDPNGIKIELNFMP